MTEENREKIREIEDTIVFEKIDLNIINQLGTKTIAKHTKNTWQPNRKPREIIQDTRQGKIAEYYVDYYLNKILKLNYLPYDYFRKDNFKKHAPFDGVLIQNTDDTIINKFKNKINEEINNSRKAGTISKELHEQMIENHLYTVEIKSTNVANCKLEFSSCSNEDEYLKKIILFIKEKHDYLEYPHLCRSSNSISNINDYFNEFYKDKCTNINEIKKFEIPFMKYFYIRVYVDFKDKRVFIIGFIPRDKFFENGPMIKKMVRKNKSENAIYFAKNIKQVNIPIKKLKNYLEGLL